MFGNVFYVRQRSVWQRQWLVEQKLRVHIHTCQLECISLYINAIASLSYILFGVSITVLISVQSPPVILFLYLFIYLFPFDSKSVWSQSSSAPSPSSPSSSSPLSWQPPGQPPVGMWSQGLTVTRQRSNTIYIQRNTGRGMKWEEKRGEGNKRGKREKEQWEESVLEEYDHSKSTYKYK